MTPPVFVSEYLLDITQCQGYIISVHLHELLTRISAHTIMCATRRDVQESFKFSAYQISVILNIILLGGTARQQPLA